MRARGMRVLRRAAVAVGVVAALAAFGLAVWFGSGQRVYDKQVEYLEEKRGLSHAEAVREVDEMEQLVEFAKGAQMIKR